MLGLIVGLLLSYCLFIIGFIVVSLLAYWLIGSVMPYCWLLVGLLLDYAWLNFCFTFGLIFGLIVGLLLV